MDLGLIQQLSAREIIKDEARIFTPWLFNNIATLNQVLNMELEVQRTEVACGPYAADIVAIDTLTSETVVIENQIGKTDHDHLGKCVTYSAVLDAKSVIWIATDFTPEHKKALDWLNDHTVQDIKFYGIQLEVWKIDDSRPALRLNLVCKPNVAVRQANLRMSNLSEAKLRQLDFWTRFSNKLLATKQFPSLQTPQPQYWYNVAVGKSGIHLSNTFNTDTDTAGLRIYIKGNFVEKMLPFLEQRKKELNTAAGEDMTWNPNPESFDKVITLTRNFDGQDQDSVEQVLSWLVKTTVGVKQCLSTILQHYK